MVRRFLWFSLAVGALSGPVLADGTGLLSKHPNDGEDKASAREFYEMTRQKREPARLPAPVSHAAQEAVPGMKIEEAQLIRHRTITYFGMHTEFSLTGHDAGGRWVAVRTDEDGGHPSAVRAVPIKEVPDAVVAEAQPYATKHGYSLTSALVVTRTERVLLRNTEHTIYYLKGTQTDRPGVEKFVWLSSKGRFRLRDLDDLMLTTVLTD